MDKDQILYQDQKEKIQIQVLFENSIAFDLVYNENSSFWAQNQWDISYESKSSKLTDF